MLNTFLLNKCLDTDLLRFIIDVKGLLGTVHLWYYPVLWFGGRLNSSHEIADILST
jgi:hypothetical protein